MDTSNDIAANFKSTVGAEIELLPEGTRRYVVSTPFMFDDGDEYTILLKRDGRGWYLTDEAHTFMHLSYEMNERDWEKGNRAEVIEQALSMFDVDSDHGELKRRVANHRFGDALFDYIQALSRITDIRLLSREIVRSTFLEDFREVLQETVPRERRSFNWHDPVHDPDGMYSVDARINERKEPIFIYALSNNNRVKDATISLLKFEQWGVSHHAMGIFENVREISDRELARFMDVADKLFSSLSGSRDRLESYLKERL